jgi:DNA-binding MarR family transcriptional regulator
MGTNNRSIPDAATVADATMAFVKTFQAWMRRASMVNAGESIPRLRLLYELHCNGPRKMTELADSLGVTPRSITVVVDALESERLVARVPHAKDRRVTMIELTGGAATVQGQFAAFEDTLNELFGSLEPNDRTALVRAFGVLAQRMRSMEPDRSGDE